MNITPMIGARVRVKGKYDPAVVDAGRMFDDLTKNFCGATFIVEGYERDDWIILRFEDGDSPDNYNGQDISSHRFKRAWLEYEYRIGDLVEFIDEGAHTQSADIFPSVGTVGEVIRICDDGDLVVAWPKESFDTSAFIYSEYYCSPHRVIPVDRPICKESDELNKFFEEM